MIICTIIIHYTDNTVFLLNLYVQSTGFYLQWMIQTGSHSDAFAQLGPSHGAEDRGRHVSEQFDTTDAPPDWMNDWTIFYWGWWVSWSPFVGMFIAKISKGRTVKNFIAGTMLAPVIYVFLWMTIFGGAGLRMEREAAGAGLCCHNLNMTHIMLRQHDSSLVTINHSECLNSSCNECSMNLMREQLNKTFTELNQDINSFMKPSW